MNEEIQKSAIVTKRGLAEMLKGGVIMDVTSAEQAKIAEETGAVAVMALERVPADICAEGGVARMSAIEKILEIQEAVSIPVMAKCRIGHYSEAKILEELEIDFIDESEVLTPADKHIVNKYDFKIPFVCGCRDLGEALRRINEGASMIRTKGEAGTGDVSEAIRHIRKMREEMAYLAGCYKLHYSDELEYKAREYQVPCSLIKEIAKKIYEEGKLPVVNFAAGGIAIPADAMECMRLGMDGIFVGSGIFKSEYPVKRAKAIVITTAYYNKLEKSVIIQDMSNLGDEMKGIAVQSMVENQRTAGR
ncbi:pyridoxal biosynthesis lyase PdxS [Candidatus Pacearchaeota archaeon RBG_19FT_COMBO_34_9]|nr:MAG: pyridoxal biosynthesis lyase PdxS [Candidatus Pacearchaeota archaeon RBG_19FT_COMBO_34_9]OGJ15914.1 MAG: pyridoxal biosynthesis lyase PdxS [Candidatus Pacearchaeota archaeon RBG_13_33_26]